MQKDGEPDKRLGKHLAMHNRISALEDVLQLQSKGTHPLPQEELVKIKKVNVPHEPEERRPCGDLDLMVSSFGSLSVGNNATYYIGSISTEVSCHERLQTPPFYSVLMLFAFLRLQSERLELPCDSPLSYRSLSI